MKVGTKVYGACDDLIELEGDVSGEVCHFGTDDRETGVLVVFSDGTMLDVKYGKLGEAIWGITVIRKGDLFDRIDSCENDADSYSDIAWFKPGLKWAKSAKKWSAVE